MYGMDGDEKNVNGVKNNIQFSLLKGEAQDYHIDEMIYTQLENWAVNKAESIAVLTVNKMYTYQQLNERANQIAWHLKELGVTKNTIVAIIAERSFDMLASIFGIWKAGGAYLPIDVNYPLKRKLQILYDSGVRIVLAMQEEEMPDEINLVLFSDICFDIQRKENPPIVSGPFDLAYVIYTSGTTGIPKGVMLEHHSMNNRIDWMQRAYPINEKDVLIQKTTYCFDVSVWEIVWWVTRGASVFMLQPNRESDIRTIVKMIEKYQISVIHFVPSVFQIFLDYIETDFDLDRIKSLKYVFCSGEALTCIQVERFAQIMKDRKVSLINLYGPTEAAIDVTHYACPKCDIPTSIPIGKPIQNTYCLIMDSDNNLVAPNEKGVLFLGGVGLARGYLNNSKLTSKVFVENPFMPEKRIYCTGDIASYTEEGIIFYHGRVDEQIKLRGIRIELKEIEYYLLKYPGIRNCVVLVNISSSGTQILSAYLVLKKKQKSYDFEPVKKYLREVLPAYMVPTSFVLVNEIPLKINGKADKKKLIEEYR